MEELGFFLKECDSGKTIISPHQKPTYAFIISIMTHTFTMCPAIKPVKQQ